MRNKPNFIPKSWPVQPDGYDLIFNNWNAIFRTADGKEYMIELKGTVSSKWQDAKEVLILERTPTNRVQVTPAFKNVKTAYQWLVKARLLSSLDDLSAMGHRYAVVTIDETDGWDEKIQRKCKGKILGVYLVDLTQPTCLCEPSTSYGATWLKNFVPDVSNFSEKEKEDGTLDEIENDDGGQDFMYLAGNGLYKIEKFYDDPEMTEEDIREYESGNPTVC